MNLNRFHVKCPACSYPLDAEGYNRPDRFQTCASCEAKVMVQALPALYRRPKGRAQAQDATLDDAVCFYHAGKQAEVLCDACGRFLCALCSLDFGEEVLCASCLELRRKDQACQTFKPRQFRYDKMALHLGFWPLLFLIFMFAADEPAALVPFIMLCLITALVAVYLVLRNWKKELLLASGRKIRMSLALIAGLLQFVMIILGINQLLDLFGGGL